MGVSAADITRRRHKRASPGKIKLLKIIEIEYIFTMLLKKNYTITLTIDKVNDIYTPEIEAAIIAEFNMRYSHKCLYGSYIVSGDSLVRNGFLICDITGNYVNISVEVECTVINYNITEVVVAKVSTIVKSGQLYLTNESANITMNMADDTKHYKLGDIVPVIVAQIQYPIYKNKIVVNAIPFKQLPDSPRFTLTDSSADDEMVATLLEEITAFEKEIAAFEKKERARYNLFARLLRKNTSGKSIYKIQDAEEGSTIYRTSAMYYTPFYAIAQTDESAIAVSKKTAVEILLNQYKLELINMIALLNIEDPNKINYIFDSFRKNEK